MRNRNNKLPMTNFDRLFDRAFGHFAASGRHRKLTLKKNPVT
jgi:hypothetical protein